MHQKHSSLDSTKTKKAFWYLYTLYRRTAEKVIYNIYYYAFEYYLWNKIQNLVKNNLQYLFHWCYFILKAMCDNSIFFYFIRIQTSSPNSQSHLLSIYLFCIYLQVERRKNSNNWKLRDKSKKEEFTTGICLTHIYTLM